MFIKLGGSPNLVVLKIRSPFQKVWEALFYSIAIYAVRPTWPLKTGPICSSETSILNQLTPRNNPEDGRIQFNRGGSPRSNNGFVLTINEHTEECGMKSSEEGVLRESFACYSAWTPASAFRAKQARRVSLARAAWLS
jgi:hypothetical protein